MAIIEEVIRLEHDNTLSFGNYLTKSKMKLDGFEVDGNIYRVKTHNELTRLEKNSKLLFESVPGSAVHGFSVSEKHTSFQIEGFEDTQVTMELEPEQEYKILVESMNVGSMKANVSGKISFSLELGKTPQSVKIEKI